MPLRKDKNIPLDFFFPLLCMVMGCANSLHNNKVVWCVALRIVYTLASLKQKT